ncbi:hypothetical protein DFH09DRAFT_1440905, partial [Mycena vulgaris]
TPFLSFPRFPPPSSLPSPLRIPVPHLRRNPPPRPYPPHPRPVHHPPLHRFAAPRPDPPPSPPAARPSSLPLHSDVPSPLATSSSHLPTLIHAPQIPHALATPGEASGQRVAPRSPAAEARTYAVDPRWTCGIEDGARGRARAGDDVFPVHMQRGRVEVPVQHLHDVYGDAQMTRPRVCRVGRVVDAQECIQRTGGAGLWMCARWCWRGLWA